MLSGFYATANTVEQIKAAVMVTGAEVSASTAFYYVGLMNSFVKRATRLAQIKYASLYDA